MMTRGGTMTRRPEAIASIRLAPDYRDEDRADLIIVRNEAGDLGVIAEHKCGQADYLGNGGASTREELIEVIEGWYGGGSWDLEWND